MVRDFSKRKCDLKTVKVILKTKKIIQSRLPKTALNNIFFTFLSYWITLDLHLTLEDLKITFKHCTKNN